MHNSYDIFSIGYRIPAKGYNTFPLHCGLPMHKFTPDHKSVRHHQMRHWWEANSLHQIKVFFTKRKLRVSDVQSSIFNHLHSRLLFSYFVIHFVGGIHSMRLCCVPLNINTSLSALREALDKSTYTARALRHSRRLLVLYLAGQQNSM